MKEDKNKTTGMNNNSSKNKNNTLKRKRVQKQISSLSNEDLLEQIMKRKREKKKSSIPKQKAKIQELSNEEILEQIMQKKKKKLSASSNKKKSSAVQSKGSSSNNKVNVEEVQSTVIETIEIDNISQIDSELIKQEPNEKIDLPNIAKEDVKEFVSDKSSFELNAIVDEVLKKADVSEKIEEQSVEEVIDYQTKKVSDKKFSGHRFGFKKYAWLLMLLLCVLAVLKFSYSYSVQDESQYVAQQREEAERLEREILLKEETYKACLAEPLSAVDTSADIDSYLEELNQYLSKYSLSVQYEDLLFGYSYAYNQDKVYYAASTIKSLDALYIYTKALNGEVDLNETMTYSKKFKWGASLYMGSLKYGTQVPLKDLVKYAVMVSDNSAHQMLVNYIGFSNLKNYGKSLGASYTLYGADNFGSITTSDALVYMRNLYNFFENGTTLGLELKQYFLEADQNDLRIVEEGVEAAHKYGQYEEIYHDIGVVYDKHPYLVAILTKEGRQKDYEGFVKEVNSRIYKLHLMYYKNREDVCHLQVYGE